MSLEAPNGFIFTLAGRPLIISVPGDVHIDDPLAKFLKQVAEHYRRHPGHGEIKAQRFECILANGTAWVEVPDLCEDEPRYVIDFLNLVARYHDDGEYERYWTNGKTKAARA